jgi:hypothetical protein
MAVSSCQAAVTSGQPAPWQSALGNDERTVAQAPQHEAKGEGVNNQNEWHELDNFLSNGIYQRNLHRSCIKYT